MRVAFFAAGPRSGLANNGGSRTILKSAEALRHIGHTVDVVATYDKFTWFDHPRPLKHLPGHADVVVACSARDVKNAKREADKKPVFWWIRGKELWQMPEEKLIQRAKWVKCIVNAQHLKDWLKNHGVKSKRCYAGLDVGFWEDEHRGMNPKPVIGCLYHEFHKTKRFDLFLELQKRLGDDYQYASTGAPRRTQFQMKGFYNACDIWFAPSELEGFHNVPAEAGLCGCLVVARRDPLGGCRDYANEETAHLFNTVDEAVDAITHPDWSKIERMKQHLLTVIGSREKNMYKFVEVLCPK